MQGVRRASGWTADELRTRFVPKSRIRHGLVSLSPWLDLVLLFVFFLLIESRLVLQPGVVVELPAGGPLGGPATEMAAVVLSLDSPGGRSEMVFFDDEPYVVGDEVRMKELKSALAAYRKEHDETVLTVHADRAVAHGTISRLIQIARDVGVHRVNMATQIIEPE
jgi:biopolymer transport protein ExbD